MKKNVFSFISIGSISLFILLFTYQAARAEIDLWDGKLIIRGTVKELWKIHDSVNDDLVEAYDNRVDYAQTAVLVEGLYTIKETRDYSLRFFGGLKWWWQKAPSSFINDQMGRTMYHHDREDWIHPQSFDRDFLTEAYIDYQSGPWQVLIGKQIVTWGNLGLGARVADVINAPDFRRGYPGENAWEELKQGMYMFRALYQSELPGDLLFEFVFNPGYHRGILLHFEGANPGSMAKGNRPWLREKSPKAERRYGDAAWTHQPRGIYSVLREKWTRDQEPTWSTENWSAGLRLRGFTFGIDWTLIYWNAKDMTPTVQSQAGLNSLAVDFFVQPGLRSRRLGYWSGPQNNVQPNQFKDMGDMHRVFEYKRYETLAGTAQRYFPELWDTIWRLEWSLEFNRPINKGDRGLSDNIGSYTGDFKTERTVLSTGLQVQKAIEIPWLAHKYFNDRRLDLSLTYTRIQVMNHDHDMVLDDKWFAWNKSVTDSIDVFFKQDMFHNKWVLVCTGNYYLQLQKWQLIPTLSYIPGGVHWRIEAGYAMFGRSNRKYTSIRADSTWRSGPLVRIRYEF